MVLKRFLCCCDVYEGSWLCGLCSMSFGALRVYLQSFNLHFRHRLSEKQRQSLPIDFQKIQLVAKLQLSTAAIAIFVSFLLLCGLCKRKRCLMYPWMAWIVAEELFSFSVIIFFIVSEVKLMYTVYLFEAITFFLSIYCLLCVYSFFKYLKEEELKKNKANVQGTFESADDDFDDNLEGPLMQVSKPV